MILLIGLIEEFLIKLDILFTVQKRLTLLGIMVFVLAVFHCYVIQQIAIDPHNYILILWYAIGSSIGAISTVSGYAKIRKWQHRRRSRKALEKARKVRWEDYRDFIEYENGRIDTGNIGECK